MTDSCPSLDVLQDFNDGRISDATLVDQITEHLGTCDKCLASLERMEPDPLADGLRTSLEIGRGDDDNPEVSSVGQFNDNVQEILSSATSSTGTWSNIPLRLLAEQHYRILAFIGQGGLGKVFLCQHESEELLAVKISNPKQIVSYQHQKQFLLDCELAASLKHPNVLPLIKFGYWDEQRMYYSTSYVESESLTDIARSSKAIPLEKAISIFIQISHAIQSAHDVGIIHRHLNPNNVLLENWASNHGPIARVTDFGFTFDSRYQFGLLEPKSSTSPFDSPESVNNDVDFIDQRADVFSLGKILKLLIRISVPRSPQVTEMLIRIVDKSTTQRRRTRYGGVDELLEDLREIPLG